MNNKMKDKSSSTFLYSKISRIINVFDGTEMNFYCTAINYYTIMKYFVDLR